MKKVNLFVVLSALMTLVGCRTSQYTARQVDVDRYNIGQTENAVDVVPDYSRHVTATSEYQITRGEAMREAEFMCLTGNKAVDVVVDPIFKIEYNPLRARKRYRATIDGYAGMYKEAPAGVKSTLNFEREDIENYKLLTDPNFAKYLYSQAEGDNYFFGDITTAPARSRSIMFASASQDKAKAAKVYDINKSLNLRNAGIGLTVAGVVSTCLIGLPCLMASDHKVTSYGITQYSPNYAARKAGAAFISIGCMSVVAGVPMWTVGSYRVKNASKVNVKLGVTSSGIGVDVNF